MNCTSVLSPGGSIARKISNYELRPQQLEMAAAIGAALEGGEHLLVEAGTGVGKSFAYLLPTIERVTDKQQRAVISTHTIALQEQLINKDIPFLASVLPHEFSAVLVKGRNNYLGRRRLQRALRRRRVLFDTSGEQVDLRRIADWADRTDDGSLSDLSRQPQPEVWDQVRSEHGNCMGRRCSEYAKCFYQRARRRANNAQLLIVNHALFFTDLAIRRQGGSLLPDYDLAVLDEAHTVADVAGEHLGISVSDAQIRFLLDRLYNERTGRGFLASCHADAAVRTVKRARATVEQFFDRLLSWQVAHGRSNGRLTVPPPVENTVSEALTELAGHVKAVRSQMTDESDRFEINSYIDRAAGLAETLEQLLEQHEEDWVYWIERTPGRRRQVALGGRPVDVGPLLKDQLFSCVSSVVLTSATLSLGSGDDFAYLRERLGAGDAAGLCLGSPFDYRRQVRVHLETSLPPPNNEREFIPTACERMAHYIKRSDGRAFVLFTGYEMTSLSPRTSVFSSRGRACRAR
jgi:ATP-dependent DNA helicase DinG